MNNIELKQSLNKIKLNEEYAKVLSEKIILNNSSNVLEDLQEIVDFTKENKLHLGYAWAIQNLGKFYGRLGELQKAEKYINESLCYFENRDNDGELSAILGFMSIAFTSNNYREALKWGMKGIEKAEKYNNVQKLWLFKTNMVALFIHIEEYDKARTQLIEMEKLPLIAKEQAIVINCINRCICEVELENYDEALVSILKGEEVARESVKNYLPKVLIEKGNILVKLGEVNTGKDIISDVLEMGDKQVTFEIEGYIYLGEAYMALNEYNKAIDIFNNTKKLITKDLQVYLKYIYKNLSDCYKELKKYKKAYDYLDKYNIVYSELKKLKDSQLVGALSDYADVDEEKNYKMLYLQNQRILDLGHKITSNLNKDVIFDILAKEIKSIIDYDVIQIAEYSEERDSFIYHLRIEKGKPLKKISVPLSESTFGGYCIKHKCDIFINDIEKEYQNYIDDFDEYIKKFNIGYDGDESETFSKSVMTVPMVINDEIIGVLSIQSFNKNAYTIKDIVTLKLLSTYIAIAFENARLYKTVRYQANYDVLTGISNRRRVMNRILKFYNEGKYSENEYFIAMLDIDNFKRINDAHGHLVGDSVLVQVARILKNSLENEEIVGRYGGEEFILMLKGTYEEVSAKLEKIRESVEKLSETIHYDEDIIITLSIGATKILESKPEETISFADKALYESKVNGKNKVTFKKR